MVVSYVISPATLTVCQDQTAVFKFIATEVGSGNDNRVFLDQFNGSSSVNGFWVSSVPTYVTFGTEYNITYTPKSSGTITLYQYDYIVLKGPVAVVGASATVSNLVTVFVIPNTLSITSTGSSTKATATGFIDISGDDLSEIFAPLEGSSGTVTNYIVKNYGTPPAQKDLNQIFSPISSGSGLSYTTGFKVNGTDLNAIFAKYQASSDFIVRTAGSGSKTVSFPTNKTANIILVGGGGGGGNGSITNSNSYFYGGNGGEGGEIKMFKVVKMSFNISYTIGTGGAVSTNGVNSTITINSTTTTARGGLAASTVGYNANGGGNGGVRGGTGLQTGNLISNPTQGKGGTSFTYNSESYNFGGGGGGGATFYNYSITTGNVAGVNGGGNGSTKLSNISFSNYRDATNGQYGGGGGGGSAYYYPSSNPAHNTSAGAAGGDGLLVIYFT